MIAPKFDLIPFNDSISKHKKYLKYILSLEQEEGWEILPADIKALTSLPHPAIYFIFQTGKCIGSISLLASPSEKFMGVGAFILEPLYRNRGLGQRVLQHCLRTFGADKLVGLLSMPDRVSLYKRCGFTETGESISAYSLTLPESRVRTEPLFPLSGLDKRRIVEYDRLTTGISRGELLACMLENAEVSTAVFDGVEPKGYALARSYSTNTGSGFRLTLYANNASVFIELLGKVLNHLRGIADTPSVHVSCPTLKAPYFEAQGFRYNAGPCPFLTTARNITSLYGDKTFAILMDEFS